MKRMEKRDLVLQMCYVLACTGLCALAACSPSARTSNGIGKPVDNKGAVHDNRGNTNKAPPAEEVTEKELLVPLYPNSKDDGSSVQDRGTKQTFVSSRVTTDSVQQVVDFYKPKLPNITQTVMAEHALLGGKFPQGEVTIAINKEDRGTTIGIATTSDKE
jgi:hypothetical protein